MSKFIKTIEAFIHWSEKFKPFKTLYKWMAESEQNKSKFLIWFNLINTSLYLTAYWSPWIFVTWTLIVPAILFRSSPIAPLINLIQMAVAKTLNFPSFLITVLFMMLTHICIFASLYMIFGVVIDSTGSPIDGLWNHFYFSVVTYTTLGYGNLVPYGFGAELIAAIEAIFGFAIFAIFIGLAASLGMRNEADNESDLPPFK